MEKEVSLITLNFFKKRQKRKQLIKRNLLNKKKRILCSLGKLKLIFAKFFSAKKERKVWYLERCRTYWENELQNCDGKQFKEQLGLSRNTFNVLVSKLRGMQRKDTNMRFSIPLNKRVPVCLYALRSSAEYRTVRNLFGIGRTTLGQMVLEFCEEVYSVLKEYLAGYPPTQSKIDEIVSGFRELGFPQCYGAIDGCHIEVSPPKLDAIDYYNFKGWYSIILFAAVDHKYRFTYINVGATGRNNDSTIFEKSLLKKCHATSPLFRSNSIKVENVDIPFFLIGDSAFRLSDIVLKPFPFTSNQSATEKIFNYKLSKCRRVVENAFGQLKARFRKIGKGLEVHVENAYKIVQACCVLHNFCIEHKDMPLDAWFDNIGVAASPSQKEQPRYSFQGNGNLTGHAIRNALAQNFAEEQSESSLLPAESSESGNVVEGPVDGTN